MSCQPERTRAAAGLSLRAGESVWAPTMRQPASFWYVARRVMRYAWDYALHRRASGATLPPVGPHYHQMHLAPFPPIFQWKASLFAC